MQVTELHRQQAYMLVTTCYGLIPETEQYDPTFTLSEADQHRVDEAVLAFSTFDTLWDKPLSEWTETELIRVLVAQYVLKKFILEAPVSLAAREFAMTFITRRIGLTCELPTTTFGLPSFDLPV